MVVVLLLLAGGLAALAVARPDPEAVTRVRDFLEYVAGEVATDRRVAVASYTRAIELARTCGASFVEGIATVGLATVWTSVGEVSRAAEAFLWLLDYWPVSGNQIRANTSHWPHAVRLVPIRLARRPTRSAMP